MGACRESPEYSQDCCEYDCVYYNTDEPKRQPELVIFFSSPLFLHYGMALQRMFSKHVCVGKPASSLRDLEVKHRDYIILYWQQQSLANMLSGPFALLVSSSSCTYSSVQNETPSVGTRGKSWVCQ